MKAALRDCYGRYWKEYRTRTITLSRLSVLLHIGIALGKLVLAAAFQSGWFLATAVYYLVLCGARGSALYKSKGMENIKNPREKFDAQLAVYRRGGAAICLLGVSYFFVCLYLYGHGSAKTYPAYLQYGVTAVAFYKIGAAVAGLRRVGKLNQPLLAYLRTVSFADACVSIVAVQYALLSMESPVHASTSSALFGMACSAVFTVMGVVMLFGRKKYREESTKPGEASRVIK